jgi:hypothetical protein
MMANPITLANMQQVLNQTTITIPIDLARVHELRADDAGPTGISTNGHAAAEVYVVLRDGYGGEDTVLAYTVNADKLVMYAESDYLSRPPLAPEGSTTRRE